MAKFFIRYSQFLAGWDSLVHVSGRVVPLHGDHGRYAGLPGHHHHRLSHVQGQQRNSGRYLPPCNKQSKSFGPPLLVDLLNFCGAVVHFLLYWLLAPAEMTPFRSVPR